MLRPGPSCLGTGWHWHCCTLERCVGSCVPEASLRQHQVVEVACAAHTFRSTSRIVWGLARCCILYQRQGKQAKGYWLEEANGRVPDTPQLYTSGPSQITGQLPLWCSVVLQPITQMPVSIGAMSDLASIFLVNTAEIAPK